MTDEPREEFQEQGRPPERARVRFSKVLTKGPRGWQVLLYHRDIQPFSERGRYPTALMVVSPAHEEGGTGRLNSARVTFGTRMKIRRASVLVAVTLNSPPVVMTWVSTAMVGRLGFSR
jgi:hypothetical protein